MTVIIGCRDKSEVWIGGDSAAVDENQVMNLVLKQKVWKAENSLIGFAGSFRHGEIAYKSGIGDPHKLRDYLATQFSEVETNFLVANTKGLYYIGGDMSLVRSREPYMAIGTGAAVAYGAMFATEGPAKDRVMLGLKAAAYHGTTVRPPFKVLKL
jgi:ATP-dependent protease HslVU (ClpYQ) peptidase subunit